MFWQWLIVGSIIALAAAHLLRSAWRAWWAPTGCGGGCSCSATAVKPSDSPSITMIPAEQLTVRVRAGKSG